MKTKNNAIKLKGLNGLYTTRKLRLNKTNVNKIVWFINIQNFLMV